MSEVSKVEQPSEVQYNLAIVRSTLVKKKRARPLGIWTAARLSPESLAVPKKVVLNEEQSESAHIIKLASLEVLTVRKTGKLLGPLEVATKKIPNKIVSVWREKQQHLHFPKNHLKQTIGESLERMQQKTSSRIATFIFCKTRRFLSTSITRQRVSSVNI